MQKKAEPQSSAIRNFLAELLSVLRWLVSVALLVGAAFCAFGLILLGPFAKGDPFPQFGWGIVLGYLGVALLSLVVGDPFLKRPPHRSLITVVDDDGKD